MIALIQRVAEASVTVDGDVVGAIGPGLRARVCAERGDAEADADRLADKVVGYRIFGDAAGRMNRSLIDVGGGLLVVSQFTLAADTTSGARPSFTPAADPQTGLARYERFVARARARAAEVATGRFGAAMRVALINDGPVTFWLRVPAGQGRAVQ